MAYNRWYTYAASISQETVTNYPLFIQSLSKCRNYFEIYEKDYIRTRKMELREGRMAKSEQEYNEMLNKLEFVKYQLFRVSFIYWQKIYVFSIQDTIFVIWKLYCLDLDCQIEEKC